MGVVSSSTNNSLQSADNTIISAAKLSVQSNSHLLSQQCLKASATSKDWLVHKETQKYLFITDTFFKNTQEVFQAFFTDDVINGHIKLQTRQFWKYLEDRIGYFYCKFPELKEMGEKLIQIQKSESKVENQTDRILALINIIKAIETRISKNKDLEMEVHKHIGPFVRNCYYETGGIFSVYLEITPLNNSTSLGSICSKAVGATIFGSVHTSLRLGALHWSWVYYNSLQVKGGVAILKGSYDSAYPEWIRGLQLPLSIFSPVNSYEELGLKLISRSKLYESGSPTEPFIKENLEPMNQEIFSQIKQKFPKEILEKFCKTVVEYNTHKEYSSYFHNCQQFCDDLIKSLNLSYYDITHTSLLEEHLQNLIEHPKDIAPLKLGENAARFLLNITDPSQQPYVRKNIAYCLIACRYFMCLLSRIIIKHKCDEPEEQQLQQEEEAALYKEGFFDFETLKESLTEQCAQLMVSWKNGENFVCDQSLLAKCYSFASQRHEAILDTWEIGPSTTCESLNTLAGLVALHPPKIPSYETHPNLKWIYGGKNATIASVIITPRKMVSSKTIIFSHGNAEDMGSFFKWADYLANKIQVNILLYDYGGYGLSKKNSDKNLNISTIFQDLLAVFHYVVAQKNDGIILWGRSLGGAPTLDLLSAINQHYHLYKSSVLGAILQSTFASGTDVMCSSISYSSSTSLDTHLATNNEEKIKFIDHPILILHGKNDKVVPFSHAQRLNKFAKNPTLVELEGDHNDLEIGNRDYMVATLSSWIDSLKPITTSQNKT